MFHEVWGQMDYHSGLGRNPVQSWHWMFTYWATTLYPEPLFTSKHGRSISFMIPSHPEFWKAELVKFGFPPFWHPFCWFVLREMGQLLLCFAPFLLQWYSLKCRYSYKSVTNRVNWWWDMTDWWWKVGFTPRAIWHSSPCWHLSSSSVPSRARATSGYWA